MNIGISEKRIGRRLVALLTTMSMTMGLIPALHLNTFAAGEFSGGSGTASDPYIIGSAADFKTLADKVNAGEESFASAYYKIPTESYNYTDKGTDYTGVRNISIDLSGYDPWTPIGTEEHPFKGNFNGSCNENKGNGSYGKIYNYKLQNDKHEITAQNRRVEALGLFGYTDGATIENVIVSTPVVGDDDNVISINTYNTYSGENTSYHCVGGIIGFAKDSTVKYCTSYGAWAVRAAMGNNGGATPEFYAGGIVGGESGSEIFRCVNNSVINMFYTEDDFDASDVAGGKRMPDAFAGGIAGGVNGISSRESIIHGSENMSEIVINVPHVKRADNIKLFAGGIAGGVSGLEKDKLELCQDYNRSANARVRVTNSQGSALTASNAVAAAGGIFGYDDTEKLVHVHDCKNDAVIMNATSLSGDSENTPLYASGIVAGHGNVDNCLNIAMITSMQPALSSGICYSVPHHCYSTGMVPGYGKAICAEEPEDKEKNYYNYFSHAANAGNNSNWQHYVSDSRVINNGELTWLLQGDQDPNYLHWTATSGSPLLAGGYYVQSGGRPLDYWLNRGWGAYNNDMPREIVAFAPAWSYRIAKYRYVTTGEGNDGVDPATGRDLKADGSFASFEQSSTDQFYAVGYGYYCGRIGALPAVAATDEKTFVQWQTSPAATKDESVNLGSSFSYSGANSTVYAVARVKFGARDNDGVYRSVYGDGNEIDALSENMEYAAKPDTTAGKFTYSLSDVTTEDEAIEDAEQYFTVSGEKLIVAKDTPVGVYAVRINAAEKSPVYTLMSSTFGVEPIDFALTAEVIKADPEYTAPQSKQRVYDGEEADVITAGSTEDGKILYTLTPTDDTSWSEAVPQASELGVYTVYWKIEGDSNHNGKSAEVVSGLIYPDSSDPANAIIVTPAADWTYDGNTYPLATVTKPSFAEIEWSGDNSIWTDTVPTAVNAGSYPVYWRVKTNDYNINDSGSFTVKVSKATLTVTPPAGLTKKYTGEAQELVTAGSAAPSGKGTMKYSLNPEVNNWSDSNWSESIPTRTNAGSYKVYYRVFPIDLNNYNDTFDKANPTFVNAEIRKLTRDDLGDSLKIVPADDWTYDGSTRRLVNETETKVPADKGLRLMYQTDGDKWDYTVPTGTDAGDYTVKWKTVGNNNIDDISGEFTVHVSKKTPEITIEKQPDWQYDGKTRQLVTVAENNDNLRFTYSVNGGAAQTTLPSAKDAGTYRVSVTSQPNSNYETYQGSFEIKCTPAQTTGSVTPNTLTFNYGAQELVAPGDDVTNGRLMYKVEGESVYSDAVPKRTDAGTYKVWYYVKGTDSNYADTAEQSVDVTIAKLDPNPTVHKSENLVYNTGAQTLLTVDTAENHGTVKYAVKTDGSAPAENDWTTDVPKAVNAGTYTVYWEVSDDSGRDDGETNLVPKSGSETVTIAKYNSSIAYIHAEDLPYNGAEQELVEEIKARNDMGTVKYAITAADVTQTPDESEWTTDIPKKKNSGDYLVWFRVDGDDNIDDVAPDKIAVAITKVVPKVSVTVKGALKYNASAEQNLIASSSVDALPGGGTLLYAVTTDASAAAESLSWSENEPQKKDNGTYYVWYRFDGDENTESIAPKKATSVIAGDIPDVTVSGKHLEYQNTPQKLIEGTIDGADIESNANVRYYISENAAETFTAAQASSWTTVFPTGTDAKKYYVWYYVPEEGSKLAVGPAVVEAEIRKDSPKDYGFEKETIEHSDKLSPDGKSFTVPWGTKIGEIPLYASSYGGYEWFHLEPDFELTTIGTYNYPAYFTATDSNYESGIVQISITVTRIKEDTPNIGIDYVAEKLTGFDPTKTYTIWGGEHSDSTNLAIPEERMTDTASEIVLKASTNHTVDSAPQNLVIPARPSAPKLNTAGGSLELHQPSFLTAPGRIDGITADMEYSVGGSGTWVTGSGAELIVPQNTTVYVRYKAVADVSFKSLPVTIEVKESERTKVQFGEKDPGINYPNHTIKDLEPNTKYTISYTDEDGKEHKYRVETDKNGEVPIEEDWHDETVSIVKNGDILYTVDSDPKELYIPPRPEPPKPQSRDSKITNVLNIETETDEYRLRTATTYKNVENADSTNEVDPDKYVVRVKATPTSFASLDAPVTVKEKTPDARIDYEKETLNNLLPNSEYVITEPDGNIISAVTDSNGEIAIKESWFGERVDGNAVDKILLIQKKGKTDDENSDPQTRPIPPRPDKPEPDSWDSKITEVDVTMEYRLASAAADYTTVENQNETKSVAPDDYEVRIKAVADVSFASLPATVTVIPMPTPNGTIDHTEIKIENLEPGADYTIIDENGNEEQFTADEDGKIPIKKEWMDTDIEIIRNGDDAVEDSEAQILPIPNFPDPDNPDNPDDPVDPQPTAAPTRRGSGSKSKATPTPVPSPTPENNPDGDNQGGGVPTLNKTDHFAYISGYDDGTFRADRTITRGETAVIFARLMTDSMNADKVYTPSFDDLSADMYFYSQVGYLEQYGIITGYEDGTFRPWESITRTEFAVIASKFAELSETEDNVFVDVDDDFWGKPFILLAHNNGWVNGYEDGTFRPKASITRAEVVSIVNRMLERSCDTEFTNNNADKIKVFGDVEKTHWAYNDILEAANGHLYVTEDGSEVWTDLN